MWIWTVTYVTATIARGEASTRQEAESHAASAQRTFVNLDRLNPNELSCAVTEAR